MPVLTPLLERLRAVRLPPGAVGSILAVPSAGEELSGEVTFLFADLDEIEHRRMTVLANARSEAAGIERAAERERERLMAEALQEGEQQASALLAERRAQAQEQIRTMLADADSEAALVRARGRQRIPALADDIVRRLLEDAR